MNAQESMKKLASAINDNPEAVISAITAFNPKIAIQTQNDAKDAKGPITGLAAIMCRYALKGKDADESASNLIHFVSTL